MASISELNIRLGLITKDFSKQLKEMEGQLRKSGQNMSDLGQRMTLGITAPLLGIGIASVRAAGDMEALRKSMEATFTGNNRSIEDARLELEQLRILALAPGLDFEQAVKASIRLQNVGYEAEIARGVIEQLANAVALTGGAAGDLDEVTNQFAQMIGKGKVYQDDLKIITGRMPVVAQLMKDTFGTTTADGINKLNISSREFVARITEAAKELPRVEGGIRNAFVNASAAARMSLATLGDVLIETFDIPGTLDALSTALTDTANWFKSLSDAAKSWIGWSLAIVASFGAIVYAIGQFNTTRAILISFYTDTLLPMIGVLKRLRESFFALSAATQAFALTAVVAGVIVAYYAFQALAGAMDTTTQEARDMANVMREANESTVAQKNEVERLTKVLGTENETMQRKEEALNKLKKISPEYYGTLSIAEGKVVGLTKATNGYIAALLKESKVKVAKAEIDKITLENLRLEEQMDAPASIKDRANALALLMVKEEQAVALRNSALEQDRRANEARMEALGAFIEETEKSTATTTKYVAKTQEQIDAEEASAKSLDEKSKALKSVKDDLAAFEQGVKLYGTTAETAEERSKALSAGIEKLLDAGFTATSKEVVSLKSKLDATGVTTKEAQEAYKKLRGEWEKPVQLAAPIIPALPQANPLGVGGPAPGPQAPVAADISVGALVEALSAMNALTAATPQAQGVLTDLQKTLLGIGKDWASTVQGVNDGTLSIGEGWRQLVDNVGKDGNTMGDAIGQVAEWLKETWDENVAAIYNASVTLANGIVELQKTRGEEEKKALDEEYAGKFAAAKGNADATAALDAELAAKKAAIDKKSGKLAKGVAIAQAIVNTAVAVTSALRAGPIAGPILAALIAAAGAVQIATIKAQPFADGGVITKPTLGLVGEYAGASSNPEIITPERLMRSIFREESGGANSIQVYGTLRGTDIEISNRKAERERGRVR